MKNLNESPFGSYIIGKTGTHRGGRGKEIQNWLEENGPVGSWCAIDDDVFDMTEIREKVVKTTFRYGLTARSIDQIYTLLTGSPKRKLNERQILS